MSSKNHRSSASHSSSSGWLFAAGVVLGAPLAIAGSWIAYSQFAIDHHAPLEPAVDAERRTFFSGTAGMLSYYADKSGTGRPLLLIHSVNAAASAYEMRPIFERFRGQRPVYALDLPGFGWSQAPLATWGIADYADHVRQLLDEIRIAKAALLGHSFGGRVAIQLAACHPERVGPLILVASAGVRPRRGPRYYARVATAKALRRLSMLPGLAGVGSRLLSRWQAKVGSRDYLAAGRRLFHGKALFRSTLRLQ